MISILAQERLLGAVLGSAITGVIVFEQRKCIYNSISDDQSQVESKSQVHLFIYYRNFMFLSPAIRNPRKAPQIFLQVSLWIRSFRSSYDSLSCTGCNPEKEVTLSMQGRVVQNDPVLHLAREPIFPRKTRSEFAHLWNKAVDQTFGPLIESVSSRKW
ncbi:hypothetical protein JRO89_XS10G0161200 [Xanthoceras sorbifolium]|uniref:ATP synthase protein MI25 n=1 Tax=Xanthoceras sorbifolium TaxID=99658 RepID=A0ABQ8HIY5_9ROSI|nr:hypothetical protein JRO89_XS10G0161200 [Xanthoceras sorbifolium]